MILKENIINYINFKAFGISYCSLICLLLAVIFSYFDLGFLLVSYW